MIVGHLDATVWSCLLLVLSSVFACLSSQASQNFRRGRDVYGDVNTFDRILRNYRNSLCPPGRVGCVRDKRLILDDLLSECSQNYGWMLPACQPERFLAAAAESTDLRDSNSLDEASIMVPRSTKSQERRLLSAGPELVELSDMPDNRLIAAVAEDGFGDAEVRNEVIEMGEDVANLWNPERKRSMDRFRDWLRPNWARRLRPHRSDLDGGPAVQQVAEAAGADDGNSQEVGGGSHGNNERHYQQRRPQLTTTETPPTRNLTTSSSDADDDDQLYPLECRPKTMTYRAHKTDKRGTTTCTGVIRITVCWGSCETGEIADWVFPGKKSYHKVCMHGQRIRRKVLLPTCEGPNSNDLSLREYHYTDAGSCVCQKCNSVDTVCVGQLAKPYLISDF